MDDAWEEVRDCADGADPWVQCDFDTEKWSCADEADNPWTQLGFVTEEPVIDKFESNFKPAIKKLLSSLLDGSTDLEAFNDKYDQLIQNFGDIQHFEKQANKLNTNFKQNVIALLNSNKDDSDKLDAVSERCEHLTQEFKKIFQYIEQISPLNINFRQDVQTQFSSIRNDLSMLNAFNERYEQLTNELKQVLNDEALVNEIGLNCLEDWGENIYDCAQDKLLKCSLLTYAYKFYFSDMISSLYAKGLLHNSIKYFDKDPEIESICSAITHAPELSKDKLKELFIVNLYEYYFKTWNHLYEKAVLLYKKNIQVDKTSELEKLGKIIELFDDTFKLQAYIHPNSLDLRRQLIRQAVLLFNNQDFQDAKGAFIHFKKNLRRHTIDDKSLLELVKAHANALAKKANQVKSARTNLSFSPANINARTATESLGVEANTHYGLSTR